MKKVVAIIGLAMVGSSFALDEYLSIEAGKVELDAGYWYVGSTGVYDPDGEKQDYPGDASPAMNLIPLQVKYGITPGLDVELAAVAAFYNEDAGDRSGIMAPDIALKYTHTPVNAGVYVDLALPFAVGDFNDPAPGLGLGFGAVYANRFGDFRLTAQAGYTINMESGDDIKAADKLLIYAKPEAMWTEFIGTYLGLKYEMFGEGENAGVGDNLDGSLITVLPGLNVALLPWLAYEVNAPITVWGTNQAASWGVGASVYVTLPK